MSTAQGLPESERYGLRSAGTSNQYDSSNLLLWISILALTRTKSLRKGDERTSTSFRRIYRDPPPIRFPFGHEEHEEAQGALVRCKAPITHFLFVFLCALR